MRIKPRDLPVTGAPYRAILGLAVVRARTRLNRGAGRRRDGANNAAGQLACVRHIHLARRICAAPLATAFKCTDHVILGSVGITSVTLNEHWPKGLRPPVE